MLVEQFFGQYFTKYDTFDTEEFRTGARQLREMVKELGDFGFNMEASWPLRTGEVVEYYYAYHIFANAIFTCANALGKSDAAGFSSVPKMTEDAGNVGMVAFLAVNPESENLETTLEYISAFAKYMLTKQDSLLLVDKSMYTDTPVMNELYEIYSDVEVYYHMDANVYWHDFTAYLNGEMELEEMIAEIERKYQLYIGE